MFSQDPKVAVLESKLNIYEELSREMLSKLESAVEKISEGNSHIASILTKHDERIEQSIKTDDLIIKMIEEIKNENRNDHKNVKNEIEKLEKKVEDLAKYRWLVAGAILVLSFIFSQSGTVVDVLTPEKNQVIIENVKK